MKKLFLKLITLVIFPTIVICQSFIIPLTVSAVGTNTSRSINFGVPVSVDVKSVHSALLADSIFDSTFTDINAGLVGVCEGTVAWGDYDNDGDLDLLVVGRTDSGTIAKVYRNDQGSFIDINAALQGVMDAHPASWVDYDNDGDLDIFLSGATRFNYQYPTTKIYENVDGIFIDAQVNLPGLTGTLNSWGDYDNDGDVDLFLAGSTDSGSTFVSIIFRNDGSGNFTDIKANLPGVWAGTATWGDYDNDGDLDIVITGYDGFGVICNLYRNEGGNFVKINNSFSDLLGGALCWGDYDNDGDLDLLCTGFAPHWVPMTMIYRNDGNGFTVTTPLEHFGFSMTAWGDYDCDGDLDIVIGGKLRLGEYLSTVYRNDGGNFVDTHPSLPLGMINNTAWGDYDNDGDLDLVVSGAIPLNPGSPGQYYTFTKIFRNNFNSNLFTSNSIPSAPTNLSASIIGDTVLLSWNKSTDSQTPQEGIGYNLRIGKNSNGEQVCSPMADLATGKRLLVQMGNTNLQNSWSIKNLPQGTYYWSVQAIDGAFAGSAFAQEQSFTISAITPTPSPRLVSIKDVLNDQGGRVTVKWAASSLDINVNLLPFYSIWRALPNIPKQSTIVNPKTITLDFKGSAYRIAKLDGEDYAWEWIANQPAHKFDFYSYTASTLYDSMSTTDGKHYFLVSAQTNNPNNFYDSNVDSGYSVDNLAPLPPEKFTGIYQDGKVILWWNRNREPDLRHYLLYRSTSPNIIGDSILLVAATRDTIFIDENPMPSEMIYYTIRAQDCHDNLSPSSSEIAIRLTNIEDKNKPITYALHQNYPNPFNPSTMITFEVPAISHITLKIYNVVGQEVAMLVNAQLEPGEHQVSWQPVGLPSGIYTYWMMAYPSNGEKAKFIDTNKMLLMK